MIHLLEVRHYKCLRYIQQRLQPFQVLIGPNASGKSTFLDVITLLREIIQDGPEAAVERRARSCRELVWMQTGDDFEIAVELKVPDDLAQQHAYPFCRYEVRIGVDPDFGGVRSLVENFWLLSRKRNRFSRRQFHQPTLFPSERRVPKTIVHEPRKHTPPGRRKVMSITEKGRVYFRSETTDWSIRLGVVKDQAAFSKLPEEERFPIATWAKKVLTEGIRFLMLNSKAMREPCRPDAPRTFQPDGSNLPKVIQTLRKEERSRFQQWLRHVRTFLPDVRDITVKEREEDRYLYLRIRYTSGAVLPSWLISDGTLRFLALTLLPYLPERDVIYLIEEPENGIHPRAVEGVFQSLSSVYRGQVFLATHSPLVLGLASPEQILCFAQTRSGATDIVLGSDHPQLADWKGEVDLSVLYAAGVLG